MYTTAPAGPRTSLQRVRDTWFSNPRADLLAGMVVALALIPEAISFSIIAGVDPKVGLYASFSIAVIIAFAGGRPGMISAATGAMALVVVTLVKEHGVEYLFAATIVAGLIQVALGALGVGRLMRFIPRTVMVGFVNALAILIFFAQLEHVLGEGVAVYAMVALGLAIMVLLPKVTTAVPAPLVAIAVLGVGAAVLHVNVPTVGDMGALPDALPGFGLPDVPFNLATLQIVFPYAFTLAIVGLLESLADRAARRRHHRHPLRQGPRVTRAGHRQRRHRVPRRHGRVRHDRPVDDQHAAPVAAPGCRRCRPACS